MVKLRRVTPEKKPKEWRFLDRDSCHICGFAFKEGEPFEWMPAVEVFNKVFVEEYPMKIQWHEECSRNVFGAKN